MTSCSDSIRNLESRVQQIEHKMQLLGNYNKDNQWITANENSIGIFLYKSKEGTQQDK